MNDITLYFDGAAKNNCSPLSPRFKDTRAGWAFLAVGRGGQVIKEASGLMPANPRLGYDEGRGTNNMAELTACLHALRWAREMKYRHVALRGDSQLVIKFLLGEQCISEKPWLAELERKIADEISCRSIPASIPGRRCLTLLPDGAGLIVSPCHVPESKNKRADRLARDVIRTLSDPRAA